jgi:type I restriction-modification system DNA methylase subunit
MQTIKELEKIAHNQHIHNVFDDFLQLVVSAFCMKRDEENYKMVANKYKEEDVKQFGNALGALILDYEKYTDTSGSWEDVIGTIFEQMNLTNSKTGQFFTPKSVCQLMAQITQSDVKEGLVNDPSCGSSRNLIAHCRLSPANRYNFTYIGQDLDLRCCLMSVINFMMFGMKGIVVHCNTLSMEIYKGWRVYLADTGLGVAPLTASQCNYYLTTLKEKEKEIIEIKPQQLNLF